MRGATRAKIFVVGAAVLISTLGLSGCRREDGSAKAAAMGAGQPPAPVTVAAAVRKPMPVRVENFGTVEAYSTVSIKSQIAGQIMKVNFAPGQEVKAGDLLFELDARPYEANLEQAKANLARNEARVKFAQGELKRYANLADRGSVAQQKYEQTQSEAKALSAGVLADQAAIDTAKIQLEYCTIRSPIGGRTGDVLVHAGNIVKANEGNLVTINQIEPIYVSFTVPQEELPGIRRQMAKGNLAVAVYDPKGLESPVEGDLTFIDNRVDPATGTILLKATFANKDHRLWPGQFVRVRMVLETQPGAVVVPSSAVQSGQNGTYVFTVGTDNTVQNVAVTVDRTVEEETVISQGVKPGQLVVTDGQLRVVPGGKVSVKNKNASDKATRGGKAAGK